MLTDLHVKNLGVIEDVALTFGPGMAAITGETGAGKTMLVTALQLVMGGRADPQVVRAGAEEALVEARFQVGDTELFLGRSVPRDGRSKAWVDGRMVPASALQEAVDGLVDVHGQHDQQTLLSPTGQRNALDAFAKVDLTPFDTARSKLFALKKELAGFGGDEHERARHRELLQHQVSEIEAAAIRDVNEDIELLAEEERLTDVDALREAAAAALQLLDSDDSTAVVSSLGAAHSLLARHAHFVSLAERAAELQALSQDLVRDLLGEIDSLEADPGRLEAVIARRRALADLRHKYGSTLEEVLAFGAKAAADLEQLLRSEERAGSLLDDIEDARRILNTEAEKVLSARKAGAVEMALLVQGRLSDLALAGARFEIVVEDEGAGTGVEFLLAANKGEPAYPLAKVASGGELARTMLAVRLVSGGGAPVMLFDEVDAGVGGTAAVALARALREVGESHQVLVVTHLPQVAAAAGTQISVSKSEQGERTVTSATVVEGEPRVRELARMLSGHPDSETARKHAEELLDEMRQSKSSGRKKKREAP